MSEAAAVAGEGEGSRRQRRGDRLQRREHRRRRFRRHGRRAYIRSVYFLPSMATLGNAICGFGAMYVAALAPDIHSRDRLTNFFSLHHFTVAAYLIFVAMIFDALDGRLARFARHTTDFGGQLDSMADVVSFGVAPAYIALLLFKAGTEQLPPPTIISRLIWAIGALYMSCAAIRLARFNVSNEHGEQHHFSFLGLPSPGAGGTVAAWVLMQQDLANTAFEMGADSRIGRLLGHCSTLCILVLPLIVLMTGLLMVSNIRYPHLVNRYLRGRRSIGRLMAVLIVVLLIVVAHQYVLAMGTMVYALWGLMSATNRRIRRRPTPVV
ncbi:MAG TPA: CDP-alcohol phosphatidyltransferase family protein [Tepidisphaeraceae bacterium]|nr:CDP-alcohol phosphatidyltransferase family protein [Tepidisphaeraceae bacterium]